MAGGIVTGPSDVLIAVDVQNDFCPGGRLAVPGGDEVVMPINSLAANFLHVVLTQDWHAAGHLSFASSHPGRSPGCGPAGRDRSRPAPMPVESPGS